MAKQVTVSTVDDIDGSEGAETVLFGLDGVNYEIDLSAANGKKLRDGLALFLDHATRVTGKGFKSAGKKSGVDNAEVRKWAEQNGATLAQRGRLPRGVVEAFVAKDVDALKRATGVAVEPEPPSTPSNVVPLNPPFEGGTPIEKPAAKKAVKKAPAAAFSAPQEKAAPAKRTRAKA